MPGGRPKSTEPLINRFMKRVNKTDTCWLWTGSIQVNGYGNLSARELTWGTRSAHRWSYTYHKGSIPEGLMIRHSCDVRKCVNPAHLLTGTSTENVRDMLERNPNGCHRKFQKDDIIKIYNAYHSGAKSQTDLANEYSVAHSTISYITRGEHYRYWTHPKINTPPE